MRVHLAVSDIRRPLLSWSPEVIAQGCLLTRRIFLTHPERTSASCCSGGYTKHSKKEVHEWSISFLIVAYVYDAAGAEASPPIEPVIVFELIDLYSLLFIRRRHYQRHDRSWLPHQLHWLIDTGQGKLIEW